MCCHVYHRTFSYIACSIPTRSFFLYFFLLEGIIELTKELAKDRNSLSRLKMHRTTAAYKTTDGLARTMQQDLLAKLRKVPFSLNMDEATSHNQTKVLTILGSYYDEESKSIGFGHLSSISLLKVNTATVFKTFKDLFEELDLPWSNLMSILMDTCVVMRGSKNGFETLIRRDLAPHLLDIDGDSCHHIHNIAKHFTKPFSLFLEKLYTGIFNDFFYSSDSCAHLETLCEYLSIKFTKPANYAPWRWLSVYDVSVSSNYMRDAYTVYYYSFLTLDEQKKYKLRLNLIYKARNVSASLKEKITSIQAEVSPKFKASTPAGTERKKMIMTKLFERRNSMTLYLSLYESVLQIFKGYVMLFQRDEPQVHKIYLQQAELIRRFFPTL